ncbi:hypothetical protein PPYR_11893 [Photinus pyralis]|uniref:Uncharacterized protein n=1 Tax=Photinus pyralis TaxID=7054 RepID=A0A5N4ACL3_PHOPY|nr:hypothetical protein PPYR_11893 [Photinus pyralis]
MLEGNEDDDVPMGGIKEAEDAFKEYSKFCKLRSVKSKIVNEKILLAYFSAIDLSIENRRVCGPTTPCLDPCCVCERI